MTLSFKAATALTRDIGINAAKIAGRKAFAISRCADAEPASKPHIGACNTVPSTQVVTRPHAADHAGHPPPSISRYPLIAHKPVIQLAPFHTWFDRPAFAVLEALPPALRSSMATAAYVVGMVDHVHPLEFGKRAEKPLHVLAIH